MEKLTKINNIKTLRRCILRKKPLYFQQNGEGVYIQINDWVKDKQIIAELIMLDKQIYTRMSKFEKYFL